MRLDHLLSKEDEVGIVLLFRGQWPRYKVRTSNSKLFPVATASHIQPDLWVFKKASFQNTTNRLCTYFSNTNISGVDALLGHTRSHSEHDG